MERKVIRLMSGFNMFTNEPCVCFISTHDNTRINSIAFKLNETDHSPYFNVYLKDNEIKDLIEFLQENISDEDENE